ncbi:hypothetical protein R3P38DRAFT_2828549, partial [Favolaschia claudopus]
RVEWATENDVKNIQRARKEFVKRVVTDAQNECCFWLVWSRRSCRRLGDGDW